MQMAEAIASGRDVVVCDGFEIGEVERAAAEWGGVTLWVGAAAPMHRQTLTVSESELAQWYFTWASPPRVVWCEPVARPVLLPARVQKVLLTQSTRQTASAWARHAGFRDPLFVPARRLGAAAARTDAASVPAGARADVVTMAHTLEALRLFRAKRAGEEAVPRYSVFSNRVLMSLAWALPTDEDEFMAVSGCGPQKWQKYGKDITQICAQVRAQL